MSIGIYRITVHILAANDTKWGGVMGLWLPALINTRKVNPFLISCLPLSWIAINKKLKSAKKHFQEMGERDALASHFVKNFLTNAQLQTCLQYVPGQRVCLRSSLCWISFFRSLNVDHELIAKTLTLRLKRKCTYACPHPCCFQNKNLDPLKHEL